MLRGKWGTFAVERALALELAATPRFQGVLQSFELAGRACKMHPATQQSLF